MNRRFAFLISLVALLWFSCGKQEINHEVEDKYTIEIGSVIRGDMTVYRDFTGTLEGIEQADLKAKIGETVTRVRVNPGDTVQAGTVLISLDSSGPSSKYQQAKAQYEFASSTLKKMKRLYEEGAISEQDFDDTRTSYRVTEANYKAAREVVDVVSPISGIVTDVTVNVGDQAFVGQKLATVSRVDSLRLRVGADPEDIDDITIGMSASVYPAGNESETVPGRVDRVARSANPETRAFDVDIVIEADHQNLRPGSFAGASLPLSELTDIVKIPDEAILLQEGLKKIFIVRGDSAFARDIETGLSSDGYTEVISGVSPGDTVVTLGQAFLPDKAAVTIDGGEVGLE